MNQTVYGFFMWFIGALLQLLGLLALFARNK